jgi:hypothetical protein
MFQKRCKATMRLPQGPALTLNLTSIGGYLRRSFSHFLPKTAPQVGVGDGCRRDPGRARTFRSRSADHWRDQGRAYEPSALPTSKPYLRRSFTCFLPKTAPQVFMSRAPSNAFSAIRAESEHL